MPATGSQCIKVNRVPFLKMNRLWLPTVKQGFGNPEHKDIFESSTEIAGTSSIYLQCFQLLYNTKHTHTHTHIQGCLLLKAAKPKP